MSRYVMISTLAPTETIHFIAGPVGQIEAAVAEVKDEQPQGWGVVCHPHPLYGGTMHNKVVTTLVKTFQGLGLNTVRFNFRGVGRSEGNYGKGQGELLDLLAVLAWIELTRGKHNIWLAGFSFGAVVAAQAATQIPVKKLVTIAPPVDNPEMRSLPPITVPWVLVQGEQDEVVPAMEVIEWAKHRDPKPIILRFPEATHFFHGHLGELRVRLEDVLRDD